MEDDEGPICYINGQRFSLPLGRAETTLLSFLRGKYLPSPNGRSNAHNIG